jgi:hypothetical protein
MVLPELRVLKLSSALRAWYWGDEGPCTGQSSLIKYRSGRRCHRWRSWTAQQAERERE